MNRDTTYTDKTYAGPFDLAKQMGVERGGEEHEAAIERIKKAAQANGKIAAMFCELIRSTSILLSQSLS